MDYIPRIGVYAICKNEENFVVRFLANLNQADEIVVVDTGSTDATLERLRFFKSSRFPQLKISSAHVSPWRFDDARNVALGLMSPKIDLCVSLDLDETLDAGWYDALVKHARQDQAEHGQLFDRYVHRFKTLWNWNNLDVEEPNISEHWHERIHRRSGFMWKLPVHEVLVTSDARTERQKFITDVMITQRPDLNKSRKSYLPLLKIALSEDPNRWRLWSFYAGEVQDQGEAQRALERALRCPDVDVPFVLTQRAELEQRSGNLEQALGTLLEACGKNPKSREAWVRLARTYKAASLKLETQLALSRAESCTDRPTGYHYDPNCWDEKFDLLKKELLS